MRAPAALVALVVGWFCLAGVGLADEPPVVKAHLLFVPAKVKAGGPSLAVLTLRILKGHHINVTKPPLKDLMPTRLTLQLPPHWKLVRTNWPPGHVQKMAFAPRPLPFYDGTVVVALRLVVSPSAPTGRQVIRGRVHYQACDDTSCLLPTSVPVSAAVEVVR